MRLLRGCVCVYTRCFGLCVFLASPWSCFLFCFANRARSIAAETAVSQRQYISTSTLTFRFARAKKKGWKKTGIKGKQPKGPVTTGRAGSVENLGVFRAIPRGNDRLKKGEQQFASRPPLLSLSLSLAFQSYMCVLTKAKRIGEAAARSEFSHRSW